MDKRALVPGDLLDERGGGGKGSAHAYPYRGPDRGKGGTFGGDQLPRNPDGGMGFLHALNRVAPIQPDRAHLQADRPLNLHSPSYHDFRGPTADVDQPGRLSIRSAKKGKLCLQSTAADFQRKTGRFQQRLGKSRLICRVAHGAGGKQVDLFRPLRSGLPAKGFHALAGLADHVRHDVSLAVQRGKDPKSLAVAIQPQKPSSIHIRNQHAQRIRTDANGCNPHSKHLVCICFGCLSLIA